jgi:hypothetical protein
MEQEKRNPIFSIDIQIRLRGAVYEFSFSRALKWLGAIAIIGLRMYRALHGAPS